MTTKPIAVIFVALCLCYDSATSAAVLGSNGVRDICPDPQVITPCTCIVTNADVDVDCSAVSGSPQLHDIFSAEPFPLRVMNSLTIADSPQVTYLYERFTRGVAFRHIQITGNSQLSDLSTLSFMDSSAVLETIDLSNNALSDLVILDTPGEFQNILSIDLSNNIISEALQNLECSPSLTRIVLRNNQIFAVGAEAFAKCTAVTELDIGENMFSLLESMVFDGLSALEKVYINNCPNLNTIADGAFQASSVTNLKEIQLSDNVNLRNFNPNALPADNLKIAIKNGGLTTLEEDSFRSILDVMVPGGGRIDVTVNTLQIISTPSPMIIFIMTIEEESNDGFFQPYMDDLSCSKSCDGFYVKNIIPKRVLQEAKLNIEITSNPELSMISENTFGSSANILRSLDLNSNALTSFVLLDSSTYPSLELLDLGSNQISANIREFSCSPALKTLRLHSNLIPAIDANAFSTCGTLETLLVGGNSFSVLSQDAFAGLTNIKVIRVNVCPELTVIQTGAFPIEVGSVLERIELNGNPKLTIFEEDWITQTDLPCNTRIEMMVSPLTTLEQPSFEPILTTFMGAGCGGLIDLMDTPIECDCDLSWLLENPGYLIHVAGKCVNLEGTPQIQDQDPTDWSNSCKSFACQFVHMYLCTASFLILSLSSESLSIPVLYDEEFVVITDTRPARAMCPVPELISPCTCDVSSTTGQVTVDCSDVSSSAELEQIFVNEPFPSFFMDKFRLSGNANVTYLLAESLHNAAFVNIEITWNPKLSVISENAFESSMTTLKKLDLAGNALTSFVLFGTMVNYDSLEYLSLADNDIIDNIRTFSCSPVLKTLDLHSNFIPAIDEYAFSNCGSLATLYVSENAFSVLSRDAFAGLPNIRSIYVSKCPNLAVIQTGAFPDVSSSLTVLRILGDTCDIEIYLMGSSQLATLEQASFEPILATFLSPMCEGFIDLEDSPIRCDCDLSWLLTEPSYLNHTVGNCVNLDGAPQIQDQDPTEWSASCESFVCQYFPMLCY
ncbi:unnamed protein product [Notodromas monacha]|uniref:Uncharacterized protein n=1 Tax=Notodromas monacha TaxID=399045 RepID=A0A7R9GAD5_9CRUS|nr:unnamed protein product [Notodromas monacha]CAG0913582.1 unnamed protein product [Notodromas monacha]